MNGDKPPLLLYSFMTWTRTALPVALLYLAFFLCRFFCHVDLFSLALRQKECYYFLHSRITSSAFRRGLHFKAECTLATRMHHI
jgi:hypothetical protein